MSMLWRASTHAHEFIFIALVCLLVACSGEEGNSAEEETNVNEDPVEQVAPSPGDEPVEEIVGRVQEGDSYYRMNCNGCHGDDLQLNTQSILNGYTSAAITQAIETVDPMAGFATILDEPQILADLAAFIASEKAIFDSSKSDQGLIRTVEQCEGVDLAPLNDLARRLTRSEYRNTVLDIFDVEISDSLDLLPLEIAPSGFTNDALSLIVTYDHVAAYSSLSELIVDRVNNWSSFVSNWTNCTDNNANCREQFIENLGEQLYRAPLNNQESSALESIFTTVQNEGDNFTTGAALVTQAMLQSPRFLYRTEIQNSNQTRQLNSYELAARLSYLIWASAPDQALLSAAGSGSLTDANELRAQAQRMLADPKAKRASEQLFEQWFALDKIKGAQRSQNLHPQFNSDIAQAMHAESMRLFDQVVWRQSLPLISIYDHEHAYVDENLAAFYGLSEVLTSLGGGISSYDLSEDLGRVGLLTQGAVAVSAGGNDASIVHRGLYVYNRVLCSSVEQPPADLDTTPPELSPGSSDRMHSKARLEDANCAGCHSQIDPFGWVFEQLDAAGQSRTQDEFGNALSSAGWLVEPHHNALPLGYDNPTEYAQIIATSSVAQDCLLIKPAQFAFGRAMDLSDSNDACALSDIRTRASGDTASYQDIVLSIVSSPAFRSVAAGN